jgi:hypothetical protein
VRRESIEPESTFRSDLLTPIFAYSPDEKTFVCCDITIIGKRALKQHRKNHGWTPIPCPHGCRNGKPYEARDSYDRHMLSSHGDGTWVECHCPLFDADTETQGCEENTLFDAPGKLSYHLRRRHNLSPDAIQQYVNTRKRPVKSAEFVNSENEEEDMDVQASAKALQRSATSPGSWQVLMKKEDFKCSDSVHARMSQVSFLTHLAHISTRVQYCIRGFKHYFLAIQL